MSELDFSAFGDDTAQRNRTIAALDAGDVLASGWIPPDDRTREESDAHGAVIASTPTLNVVGSSVNADATKVFLWDCWEKALGRKYLGTHQLTGSCVGAGGGNALFSLAAADKIRRGDRERAVIPFWLYPYGISRQLAGMRGRGEGSLGSTFAQAVREYGHVPADGAGLPAFKESDGIVWGSSAEYEWSDGRRAGEDLRTEAKPHLVKSTALCRSPDDVREAIKNYYPVVHASNWGGLMQCPVKGTSEPVLLSRRATTWNHQMSVHGWQDHPEHGEIFYVLNQWGLDVHGTCPSGAPRGGFWIKRADMADIVSQGETFALSQFDGFPAVDVPLDFSAF